MRQAQEVVARPFVTGLNVVQTLAPAAQLGPFGYLAGGAFLVGFVWETVADLQKFYFKSKNPDKCAHYLHLICIRKQPLSQYERLNTAPASGVGDHLRWAICAKAQKCSCPVRSGGLRGHLVMQICRLGAVRAQPASQLLWGDPGVGVPHCPGGDSWRPCSPPLDSCKPHLHCIPLAVCVR